MLIILERHLHAGNGAYDVGRLCSDFDRDRQCPNRSLLKTIVFPHTGNNFHLCKRDVHPSWMLLCDAGVCCGEDADAAGVQLEDQAILGIDADAVACEFFAVGNECHAATQLGAKTSPTCDYLIWGLASIGQPVIERGEQPLCKRDAVADRSAFDVDACGDGAKIGWEGLNLLVAVDAYADDVSATSLFSKVARWLRRYMRSR